MQAPSLMQLNICSPPEPSCCHSHLATTSALKKNITQGYSAGVFALFLAPSACEGSWASLVWDRNINVLLIKFFKVRGEEEKQWVQHIAQKQPPCRTEDLDKLLLCPAMKPP